MNSSCPVCNLQIILVEETISKIKSKFGTDTPTESFHVGCWDKRSVIT